MLFRHRESSVLSWKVTQRNISLGTINEDFYILSTTHRVFVVCGCGAQLLPVAAELFLYSVFLQTCSNKCSD